MNVNRKIKLAKFDHLILRGTVIFSNFPNIYFKWTSPDPFTHPIFVHYLHLISGYCLSLQVVNLVQIISVLFT